MTEPYVLGKSKKYDHNYKRFKRTKLLLKFLVFIIIVSAGFIAFDIWRDSRKQQPVVSKTYKVELVASNQTFNTEFFRFDIEKDWVFDEKSSTKTKFVYKKMQSNLIEHEIDIYVNEPNAVFEATRVLPVSVDEGSKLLAGPISEHCKAAFPAKGGNRDPAVVKFANTSLKCNPDDIRYRLVVGLVNEGNILKLKRENGQVASYMITYQDLTFNNSGIDFSKIINTFQAK